MSNLWSFEDNHRVRIPAGKWTRLPFDGIAQVEEFTPDAKVQVSLHAGTTQGTDFISFRLGRKPDDGGPIDWTGYQDYRVPSTKRTFSFSPLWVGDLSPGIDYVLDVRSNKTFIIGSRTYRGTARHA